MPYVYNPLLKENLQKDNSSTIEREIDALQSALDTLQGNKITKCFTASDLSEIDNGEIIQWQGVDNTTIDGTTFKKGYFYINTQSSSVIPTDTPYYQYSYASDIHKVGNISYGDFSINYGTKLYVIDTITVSPQFLLYNNYDSQLFKYLWVQPNSSSNYPMQGDNAFNLFSGEHVVFSTGFPSYVLSDGGTIKGTNTSYSTVQSFKKVIDIETLKEYFLFDNGSQSDYRCVVLFSTNGDSVFQALIMDRQTTSEPITYYTNSFSQCDTQSRLQNVENDSEGDINILSNLNVNGNLIVQGTQTSVHTQEIDSESDNINLRVNNPLGLENGKESGVKVLNYDGNNTNCFLGVDNQGWARVGDEDGTLQKLATIEENPTNGEFVKYNTTTKQLESGTIPPPDNATTTTDGLMSATDKVKLNGIATGAQVNPTASTVATYSGSGVTIKAVKYGRIVTIFVTSATTSNISVTLGAIYKPLQKFSTGFSFSSSNSVSVTIDTDGKAVVTGILNTMTPAMFTYFSAS